MDAYSNVLSGGLKLKGTAGSTNVIIKKKKKSSKKRKRDEEEDDGGREESKKEMLAEDEEGKDTATLISLGKTKAQLKFEASQKRREKEIASNVKSHRERIKDMNEKLSKITEFNDIPRISAAGNG